MRLGALAASWVLAATCAALIPAAAYAQGPPAHTDPEAPKRVAEEAYQAYTNREYQKAIDLLEKIRQQRPIPTVLLIQARSYAALRRYIEARNAYREAASWKATPQDPKPFAQAVDDAKRELFDIEKKIAHLRVDVSAAGTLANKPLVFIAGRERGAPGAELEIDPGTYQVEIRGYDRAPEPRSVTLAEGEREVVTFTIAPAPATDPAAPKAEPRPDYVPAIVSFSIGGAGLVLGAVLGGLAIAEESELAVQCPTKDCDGSLRDSYDKAVSYSWGSTISLILGGAGVVAGTVLVIVPPTSEQPAATTARVSVGLGGVRVSVGF
jgi:tetratricopeptide (TPR) repeat protein